MNYLYVDIHSNTFSIDLINEQGSCLKSSTHDYIPRNSNNDMCFRLLTEITSFNYVDSNQFLNLKGIILTSPLLEKNNISKNADHHTTLKTYERYLQEHLDISVVIMRKIHAELLYETAHGVSKHSTHTLYIEIGEWVQGAIMTHGHVLKGTLALPVRLAISLLIIKEFLVTVEISAVFERYASTRSLIAMVDSKIKNGMIKRSFQGNPVTLEAIFDLVSDNHELANVLTRWINFISDGLVALVHLFNPEHIIISGYVASENKYFLAPLSERIKNKVIPEFAHSLKITSATPLENKHFLGATVGFDTLIPLSAEQEIPLLEAEPISPAN